MRCNMPFHIMNTKSKHSLRFELGEKVGPLLEFHWLSIGPYVLLERRMNGE